MSCEVWGDIALNSRLRSRWPWSWEELLARSSGPLSSHVPYQGKADSQLAIPERWLPLGRALCHLAPVLPGKRGTWGTEEAPFQPWQHAQLLVLPLGSRLPFPPGRPCCGCIPDIAPGSPPPPLGQGQSWVWEGSRNLAKFIPICMCFLGPSLLHGTFEFIKGPPHPQQAVSGCIFTLTHTVSFSWAPLSESLAVSEHQASPL